MENAMDEINVRFANDEYVVCKGKCPYGNCLLHCSTLKKENFTCKYGQIVCFCKTYEGAIKKSEEIK